MVNSSSFILCSRAHCLSLSTSPMSGQSPPPFIEEAVSLASDSVDLHSHSKQINTRVHNDLYTTCINECTKVQNPRRPRVREALNVCARMLERHVRLKLKVGSVHCWKRYSFERSSTHACTPSCSNRWCFAVHQEYLIAGKPE